MSEPTQTAGGRPARKVRRSAIWGWYLFDWASQPFYTLITTFIFAPYFANYLAPTPEKGQAWWGYATAAAGLTIAFLSPVLGSMADASGPRKPWILVFSAMLVGGSAALWFGVPGAQDTIPIVLAGFIVATIGAEFAIVFTNAMMPDLVGREELGRLSGNGWAIGYAGGLISLVIVLLLLASQGDSGLTLIGMEPLFGLDPVAKEGDRAAGPLSAIWYALFVIPLFLFTPDTPRKMLPGSAITRGFAELGQTLSGLFERGNVLLYLVASLFYRDALVALFAFGGIYAAGVLGWETLQIGIFGILLTITGTFGSVLGGWCDDYFGPKPVVVTSLAILFVCCLGIVSTTPDSILFFIDVAPRAPDGGLFSSVSEQLFLLLGAVIGAAAGPMQSASRTLLIRLSPQGRMTQYFGLYALTGKVTSFIGPLSIAIVTDLSGSQRVGIVPMLVLFGLGLVLLFAVRDENPG